MTTGSVIQTDLLGRRFRFQTAPGLFSADRVDDGTRLLLARLPEGTPRDVLDLGCGYGALGLPVAARFSAANVVLADRDLLAVEMARTNAHEAGLTNVTCRGSLGYRDLRGGAYDWVLCNIPARIGRAAIRLLLSGGADRLRRGGEVRIVVIRDLGPVVEALATSERLPITLVDAGPRHRVYRLPGPLEVSLNEETPYLLDQVSVTGGGELLTLQRPHDISEDPAHLRDAVPLLLDCLPKRDIGRALVWRGGYGPPALALAIRGATVVAADRDLLLTTYTRRNAEVLGLELETCDILWPHEAKGEPFDLAVCESIASAGEESADREAAEALQLLRPGGTLLRLTRSPKASDTTLAKRGAWAVVQARRGAG